MVRKAQDGLNSGKRPAPKRASTRPRRSVPAGDPAPPLAVEPAPPATANVAKGAKALIQAGLKALGEVRGDMVARQTRVFELLLGIGQSPAWSGAATERTRSLADPFGKFEDVFDQRVARSLERLGMPSPQVLQALAEQVKLLAEAATEAEPAKPRKR